MALLHRFSFGNFSIIEVDANPSGSISGFDTGSLAVDSASGSLYINVDGQLDWQPFASGTIITDHGALTGLLDDDHTQYVLLAGRTGGQIVSGSNDGSGPLKLAGGGGQNVFITASVLQMHQHSGFDGSSYFQTTNAIQTVGATSAQLFTLAIPANVVGFAEAFVAARQEDGADTDYAAYVRHALVRSTGSAVQIGDGTGPLKGRYSSVFTEESDKDWDVVVDASGTDLIVVVSGSTGKTVNWSGTLRYQFISGSN